jgi:hypothetical protein
MPLWISAGILDIRRHLESDKKLFFCEICPNKIQAQILKQNAKKFKTHWFMVEKPIFQPFWKSPPFWKPVKRTSQFKFWRSYIYTKFGKNFTSETKNFEWKFSLANSAYSDFENSEIRFRLCMKNSKEIFQKCQK